MLTLPLSASDLAVRSALTFRAEQCAALFFLRESEPEATSTRRFGLDEIARLIACCGSSSRG